MKWKSFTAGVLCSLGLMSLTFSVNAETSSQSTGEQDREYWVKAMTQMAEPVLSNLGDNTLRKNMPFESLSKGRSQFTHLEAVGRLLCGFAPWLELGPDDTPEGQLRKKYIDLTVKGLSNAVDPESPDYLVFGKPYQPLVDAAFLAQGLLRAPKQLWGNLDEKAKANMITELKRTRAIKPWDNNWILFASTIEACLLEFTGECDKERLLHGVKKFRDNWYKGDSVYGDGAQFHMDYYNSFVIHPMLTDVLEVMKKHKMPEADFLKAQNRRFTRYAEIQERLISPEGTYPVQGRSITYRLGVFHALAQAGLTKKLPSKVKPAQVRCALTAVMKRQMEAPNTYDEKGWLRVGFAGSQLKMSETYVSTGSLYMCSMAFLPLGLPPTDPFWADPAADWTNKKAWSGVDVGADHAVN